MGQFYRRWRKVIAIVGLSFAVLAWVPAFYLLGQGSPRVVEYSAPRPSSDRPESATYLSPLLSEEEVAQKKFIPSSSLVKAVNTLFRHGMADPRGGQYRTIIVIINRNYTGRSDPFYLDEYPKRIEPELNTVTTHGWVPMPLGIPGKTAVCWDGQRYPLLAVGDPADLQQDIDSMIKALNYGYVQHDLIDPVLRVSYTTVYPLRAAMMLRYGKKEQAAKFWYAWTCRDPRLAREDTYYFLVREWLWGYFNNMIQAHALGDDETATRKVKQLLRIRKMAEKELQRRGVTHPTEVGTDDKLTMLPYIDFLTPLPQLLDDQNNRDRERATKRLTFPQIQALNDRDQRIDALITMLDEDQSQHMWMNGPVRPSSDMLLHALISEGDAAVKPLLDCLEHDDRLTRVVELYSDERSLRIPIGVYQPAFQALCEIKGVTVIKGLPEEPWKLTPEETKRLRRKMAKMIREFVKPPVILNEQKATK